MSKLYLNVGCGLVAIKGCVNIDVEGPPNSIADVIADIRKLPYEDNSVDGIIANQVMEHFTRDEHPAVLQEFYRVLCMGGKLHIEVPDLTKCIRNFIDNKGGMADYWYQCIYGLDRYPTDRHLSGFTWQSLTDLLFKFSFGHIQHIPNPKDAEHNICLIAEKVEPRNFRL